MAFDFAALNAVRHRNRTDVPVAAAGSPTAKAEMVHSLIHKGVGMAVAATAGAIDSGGFWKGGMPEIGSAGSGVGLDILGGVGLSIFEFVSVWKGMKLGYAAPVVSGAADGLLFYWAGKQGQLWGASKAKASTAGAPGAPTSTGFNYALEQGGRTVPPAAATGTGQFAYDPLHGFAAQ